MTTVRTGNVERVTSEPTAPPQARPWNGYAIAALVLGIVGIAGIPLVPSILALVFGYKAREEIDRSGGVEQGRGLAVAGIVLGWVGVGLVALVTVVAIIVLVAVAAAAA